MSTTISNQTRIIIFLFLSLIFGECSNVIDTIPSLPNNTLANGYFNLIVKTRFTKPSPNQPCGWYYQGNRIQPEFWNTGASGYACNSKQFPSNDGKYDISCNDLGNELASNFTILGNINKGTLNASVHCNASPLLTLPTITVQDCTPTLPYNVTVEATTYQFNDNGTFSCPNNTTLFTSDRNMLPTNQSTCQVTAKWENEEFVQCWTAPSVTLSGDFNVMEGTNLTLNCNYDDVTPVGNSSIFYVGNVSYIKPKMKPLVLTFNSSYNSKTVSCQAVTPYTTKAEFNNTGRSNSKTIYIMYCNRAISNGVVVEADTYQRNDTGMFSCTNNGTLFTSDGNKLSSPETTCQDTAKWINEDSVQCWTAPSVSLSGNLNGMEGDNITLNCSYVNTIPFGNMTRFFVRNVNYTKPKTEPLILKLQPEDNNKEVSCQALTPYTSKPEYSAMGKSNVKTINVTYVPYTETQVSCPWKISQTGTCDIVFFSNPPSSFVSLAHNEEAVLNVDSQIVPGTNDRQTFTYTSIQVAQNESGNYTLFLKSSLSQHLSINFTIIVTGTTDDSSSPSSSFTLIIGVSCAAAVIVIVLIVIAVILFRRRKKLAGNEALHNNSRTSAYEQVDKEREERNNPLYASQNPPNVQDKLSKIDDMKIVYYASTTSQNDVDTAYSTLDKKTRNGSTGLHEKEENKNTLYNFAATSQAHDENKSIIEKQENINPLYGPSAQSHAAYTEVENNNFSDKQENINPLYGPSTQSGFNEKQENINPLYGPSAQPHTGYAEVKNKSLDEKEENINPLYGLSAQSTVDHAQDSNEKQENINPLYGSSTQPHTGYAEVKNKSFDEKQENVNPLYGLSAQSTVDYAQDLNEKQENINPLYGPSAQSDQSSVNYAQVTKKRKGDSEKEEKVNPLYAPSKFADGGSTC